MGLAAALVGAPFLVITAVQRGSAGFIIGASVFAATMVLLYLASTLYHAPLMSRAKRVLLVSDHAVIFLFIAGIYTPFTLGVLVYTTATSVAEAAAFYQEQLPALGWQPTADPVVAETAALVDSAQADQQLSVIITTDEDGTSVHLLLGPIQP